MKRRKFLGAVAGGVAAGPAIGAMLTTAMAAAPQKRTRSSRPNFIFIIADDLTYRAIHENNAEVLTPNIDRLAAAGCSFSHCFHQGSWSPAVCLPSRTMLNSGLTAFHAQRSASAVHTWGQTLGAVGYDTFMCGKWHMSEHVGETLLQRSFKELGPVSPGMLHSTDIDGDAYDRPNDGVRWSPTDTAQKGHWLDTRLWLNDESGGIRHSSAIFADSFIDHLREKAARRDAPFFMYLGFTAPHDPRQSPQEYLDLYQRDAIGVPPNFMPEHPFDEGDHRLRDELLAPFPRTKESIQLHRHEYYAIITHMDHQVGRILDALEASGRADNTYVIFTADHGLAVGEHGLMGKQNMYDCSVRIPLIIAGPSIRPGLRVEELVYQHSVYATACELAGIDVPQSVQFPSLAPMLRGEAAPVHDAVFSYYREYQRMVRTKTHKLIVYPHIKRTQLFDLEKDPWEMNDLSDDPQAATVKSALMERLLAFQRELDDPLDLDNPAPPNACA